ncbi:MAG: hypothetical protein ACLQFR_27595 [Streptosporangiaceae bacterium]
MPPALGTGPGVLSRCQAWWPGSRRRREFSRLALTELDIRRLDERIDALLDVLAQVCDYSGQPEAAEEFRALSGEPVPAVPDLRLVRGQQ